MPLLFLYTKTRQSEDCRVLYFSYVMLSRSRDYMDMNA